MRGERVHQSTLAPEFSFYLHVLRIGLALGVFVTHAVKRPFGGPWPLDGYQGEEFVVGFFVLSGLLLPFSLARQVTWKEWACARFVRLQGLLIPGVAVAIAVPYLLTASGRTFTSPVLPQANDLVCGLATLAFVNRVWFFHCEPAANPPLWFMGYLAWFSVFMAARYYLDKKIRMAGMFLVAGLAGPQILLLLPLFLLGTVAEAVLRFPVSRRTAVWLYGVSVVGGGAYVLSGLSPLSPGNPLNWRLTALIGGEVVHFVGYSRWLLTDLLWGGIFALHLAASGWLLNEVRPQIDRFRTARYRVANWLADRTGHVYVLHAPLLLGVHSLVTEEPRVGWIMLGLIDASILIGCFLLGGWMLKLERRLRSFVSCRTEAGVTRLR